MVEHVYEKCFFNQCALSYLGHSSTAPVCLGLFCLFSVALRSALGQSCAFSLSSSISLCVLHIIFQVGYFVDLMVIVN